MIKPKKKKLKQLLTYSISYCLLILFIIGLRLLHGMEVSLRYYTIITIVIFTFIVVLLFVEPKHIERILPKKSPISLIIVFMLRFSSLALQKVTNIKHNQEMRGAKFRGFAQLKSYMSLLVPSIIVALRWSENVSEGIKMRGGD